MYCVQNSVFMNIVLLCCYSQVFVENIKSEVFRDGYNYLINWHIIQKLLQYGNILKYPISINLILRVIPHSKPKNIDMQSAALHCGKWWVQHCHYHERQVEILHGGDSEDGEVGDVPEPGEEEEWL